MTLVWKTRRGGRYHRSPDCPGIADGHAKAASEGYANHAAEQVDLGGLGGAVAPCARCWTPALQDDPWLAARLSAEVLADSSYELDFFDQVLRRVRGLDPDYVRVQHPAAGVSGTEYRLDYAILRPGEPRLGIEIDGFQKTKTHNEGDAARQGSMSARQNDLVNAGWRLLRFTNQQVRTEPGTCRTQLEDALATRAAQSHPARPTPAAPQFGSPAHDSPAGPSSTTGTDRRPTAGSAPGTASGFAPEAAAGSRPHRSLLVAAAVVALLALAATLWHLGTDPESPATPSVDPAGSTCPPSHAIKGNLADDGERIYHRPGNRYYDATAPEECFASPTDAEDGGYRPSRV